MLTNTNIGLNQLVKDVYTLTAYDFGVPLLVQRRLSTEFFFEKPYRGGIPDKRIPECLFLTFLEIVEGGNRARYLCIWCFYRLYSGGRPLINVFLWVYFEVFDSSECFKIVTELVIYVFGVFNVIIGVLW